MKDNILKGSSILITGGTGTFGNGFVKRVVSTYEPRRIIIYSRDEYKQMEMRKRFQQWDGILRFFIGDVRDEDRLERAMCGVDYVVHAAAIKQVTVCESNPIEAIKTNINGAINVINAAINANVKKVITLSTDKSVNPINLYGGTKMVSDKLFISSNTYSGTRGPVFSVVRYGNVAGSRGSVVPLFEEVINSGKTILPITDYRMTRFWISVKEGVDLVLSAIEEAKGGEIYVSKIPSFRIKDLAEAMCPGVMTEEVGMREGEKLHETMITSEDAARTYEYDNKYIIYPQYDWWHEDMMTQGGRKVDEDFEYNSRTNSEWLSVDMIRERLKTDTNA